MLRLSRAAYLVAILCGAACGDATETSNNAETQARPGWPAYGGDAGGSRYSHASQIDRSNVSRLEPAWTYRTGEFSHDEGEGASDGAMAGPCSNCHGSNTKFEATPFLHGDNLYLSTPFKHVISSDLSAQTFACVARRGHPNLGGELTMAQFVSLAHLLVAPDKGDTRGVIDRRLAELGARRRVQFSVPHFLLACHLAAQSDYLLTIPRQLAEAVIDFYPLALHTLPFDVPGFTIGMHWHRARDRDPELARFRSFVSAVAIEATA